MPSSIRPLTASSSSTRRADKAFNRGAERLFGYPESEVLGRNVSVLMPSPYHQEHDGYLQRFLATGDARVMVEDAKSPAADGMAVFPLHLSVGEMRIGGQRKFGHVHDLTERVWLEGELGSSEARWKEVIDSAVDGIIVIDAHGRVEAFNPAAERLFGYSATRCSVMTWTCSCRSPYARSTTRTLGRHLATGRAEDHRDRARSAGSSERRHDVSAPLSVGQITGARRTEVHGHSSRSVWPAFRWRSNSASGPLAKLGGWPP